jgi:transposase-like protein
MAKGIKAKDSPICIFCKSNRTGVRNVVATIKGKKLRYYCKDCGHTFYKENKEEYEQW